MKYASIKKNLSIRSAVIWIIAILFVFLFIYSAFELQESKMLNTKNVTHFLSQFGPLASVLYVLLMVLAVVTPIPDSLVTVAGGYLFGPVLGSVFSLLGLAIGTSFDFWLARGLGRSFVAKKFPHSIQLIDRYAQKSGWWTVFIMRVLPSVTFDFVGYSAGLSSMPYGIYLGSTLLGAVPMTLFTIFIGNSLHIKSLHFAFAVIVVGLIAVTVGSYIFHRLHISSLSESGKKIMKKFPNIFLYYIAHAKKILSKRSDSTSSHKL